MPKAFTPKVVTANHLLDGDVIYQTETGWTRVLQDAEVLQDEAHADLRLIDDPSAYRQASATPSDAASRTGFTPNASPAASAPSAKQQ